MVTHTLQLLDGAYDITIASGLMQQCGTLLRTQFAPGLANGETCRIMVVSDGNVAAHYLKPVVDSLAAAGFEVHTHVVSPGEHSKSFAVLSAVVESMAEAHLTRTDLALALGGGIIGDLTGFAAGCYLRGIRFIQMPTSLLAAVDASVGGKTAVNLQHGKNLAGMFHQPSAVLCDPDALHTLSELCLADGAAEAIKTGILGDAELFAIYESQNSAERYEDIIAHSVAYKARIVMEDPTEHGVRKLLNLGHTAGHAIELASDFRISHGHAVAIGMAMMARAACKRGMLSAEDCKRILQTLKRNDLPTQSPYPAEHLAELAQLDKKAASTSITVILPCGIGHCVMEKMPLDALEALFADGMEETA